MSRRGQTTKATAVVLAVALATAGTGAGRPASAQQAGCAWLDLSQPVATRVSELVSAMTLQQKISLMQPVVASTGPYAGYEHYVPGIPSLCVPAVAQQDDSAGVAAGATGVTQLPAPIAAASTWDPDVLRQYGTVIGAEMRAKGIAFALAPTLNLVRVPQWGRAFETLGEDPYLTTQLGDPDIEGIQSQGVIAEVKHYAEYNQETNRTPSLGLDDEIISERTMQETELSIFGSAVDTAHAGAVMCAFPEINGYFTCESPYLNSVLRDQYGFKGDLRADNPAPVSSDVTAANAGLDQAVSPAFSASALLADVQDGSISEATINAAVAAIVYPMFQMGVFNNPPTGNLAADVSTPQHVAFAGQTAAQGTVLLRNSGLLPLDTRSLRSIAVIGADAGPYPLSSGGGSAHVLSDSVVSPLQGITARAGQGVSVSYSMGSGPYDALPDIPAASFTPAQGSGPGLTAQVYPDTTLSGTPAITQTDPTVDLEASGSPLADGSAAWSESWTGTLTPTVTGATEFSLTCDRPCELSIGGQVVVNNSQVAAYMAHHTATGTADLTAGQPVPVEVTYRHSGGNTASAIAQLGWLPPGTTPPSITQAAAAARAAQVAIVFAGTYESEGFDQPNLSLSGVDDQLIEAVAQANPNTIVVLNTGGPVLMPWLNQVKGVLEAWYPGQQDGAAIASVLFGDTDPGGKLPVTFPASESQPLSADPARWPGIGGQVQYSEGLDVGYRWYDANGLTPLFPFGYGLSYTRFSFSGLRVTPAAGHAPDPNGDPDRVVATVTARVTNTGSRAGSEVAQLYLGDPAATGEPVRQLRGFQRVELAPGHTAVVRFGLTARDLAYWDTSGSDWAVAPGSYQVWVGDSSALTSLPLTSSFTVR